MFPKLSTGRVDGQLTNILLAYKNPEFIADMVMPVVPNLAEESGKLAQMGTAHLRQYSTKRALYDESGHRINFTIDNDNTYAIDYYDLESYVPDRLQNQLQKPFDARNAAQMTVMNGLQLEREIALATALTSTSVLTNNTTLSGTSQYDDPTNSNPDVDFDTARDSVQSKTGHEANMVVMSRAVANALRRHPWFLEIAQSALKGGASKVQALSPEAFVETLKAWYGVEYVLIGKAIKITSAEGQTVTKAAVWGNDVVWAYRPKGPSLFEPSFGYSFQLTGHQLQTDIRRHQNDIGDLVRVQWAYQDKILDTNAAYLIKDAI